MSGECCCEVSPPEFGGSIPDRDCPIHGETAPNGTPRVTVTITPLEETP